MYNHYYVRSIEIGNQDKIDYETYPFNLTFTRHLRQLNFHKNVTFIIGENGSGKSTLLEAIAIKVGMNPEGGSKNFNFSTRESHSNLHEFIKIHKSHIPPENHFFLRSESYFNLVTEIEKLDAEFSFGPPIINSFGGKSLHEQSHGESFFALFTHRFGPNGLYILDEPEAALSLNRQMALLSRIHQLCQENCQFIIATHSPILLSYPEAFIYEINEAGMDLVEYEYTDIYMTTKYFLDNYQKIHKELF